MSGKPGKVSNTTEIPGLFKITKEHHGNEHSVNRYFFRFQLNHPVTGESLNVRVIVSINYHDRFGRGDGISFNVVYKTKDDKFLRLILIRITNIISRLQNERCFSEIGLAAFIARHSLEIDNKCYDSCYSLYRTLTFEHEDELFEMWRRNGDFE